MLNVLLEARYREIWERLHDRLAQEEQVSHPLFLRVPSTWSTVEQRLLIVGEHTHGWPKGSVFGKSLGSDPVRALCDLYEDYDLGAASPTSPFWAASHELYGRLNPGAPQGGFLWSNLVKVDQDGRRPRPELEESVAALGLLQSEIELVEPDVVVFFTGPSYDERLRRLFEGVHFRPVRRGLDWLDHERLPRRTLRSFHPIHLWRLGCRGRIEEIAEMLLLGTPVAA